MGRYELGMACLNGHAVNSAADTNPVQNAKCCAKCGEETITACEQCGANIRGNYDVPGVISIGFGWTPPAYCHDCGGPYPWTLRSKDAISAAIDAIDDLYPDEREQLRKSIPDILTETPMSQVAALRFKKAIARIGAVGGKVMTDVLAKVAAEVVKESLGIKQSP
ncbi:MAG TPA: DUF2321 domain-containing protein [Pirellulales bacterium]|nr:DUF2321 domain-containing protein [Pirellulales bacterium]